MKKFYNKVALITGGTSGIGLATAHAFIEEGATVIITGRYEETLMKTVEQLGSHAHGIVSDTSKMGDIHALPALVQAISPRIDVVFANAGSAKFASIETVDETLFNEHFDVLVKGPFFTVQQLLPLINPNGSVIFNTSIVTEYGTKNLSIYSAAKAAIQSFVKTFAAECTDRHIRVNAVSPGYTKTDMMRRTGMSREQVDSTVSSVTPTIPFGRFAHPSETAAAVAFLASDDASYIHGTEILVDGGFLAVR